MEIGRWGGRKFTVSPAVVRGFTGLTLKGSSETENKTADKQMYVARKNGKPAEVSLSVVLHRNLGCDVRAEAVEFIRAAQDGKYDYMYIANEKLVPCKLMLTDAEVSDTTLDTYGEWVTCKVKLTLKQCTKFDTETAKTNTSTKTTTTKTSTTKEYYSTTTVDSKAKNETINTTNKVVNEAQNTSSTKENTASRTSTSTTTATKTTSGFTFAPSSTSTSKSGGTSGAAVNKIVAMVK